MQVPESFFYGKPSSPEVDKKKEERKILQSGDDESFKKVLEQQPKKTRTQVDVNTKRQGKSFEEIEQGFVSSNDEVEEEDSKEFSLFVPKKSVKKQDNLTTFFEKPEEEIGEEIAHAEDPAKKVVQSGKELPKETETINKHQYAPAVSDQQQLLDQVRQQYGGIATPKKTHKESVFDFASKPLSKKEGETIKEVPLESEEPTVPPDLSEEIAEASDPTKKQIHLGKELPKNEDILTKKQQPLDKVDQQKQLENSGQEYGSLLVDKKKQVKNPFDFIPKPIPKEDSNKTMNAVSPDEPETEIADLPQKIAEAPPKQTPKDALATFNAVIEKEAPRVQQTIQKPEAKTVESPVKEKTSRPIKDVPLDPRAIAFVNPEAGHEQDIAQLGINEGQTVEKPPLAHRLKEIVDQIIKEIYTLSYEGKSETTLILHHPPLFVGVKVTIETFKLAPNELNITFTNLTGPGKKILDENMASLKTALEKNDKGLIVHQLTTTTLNEIPRYLAADADQFKGRDEEKGNSQQYQEPEQQKEKKRKR